MYPNQIKEALQTVKYPGTGKNIVESEILADDIRIDGDALSFSLNLPKQNDPFARSLAKAAEQAIHTYVGADIQVTVNLSYPQPAQKPAEENSMSHVKNIIAVSSGKGGVGKSTVAANLAMSLANLGYRVGLLDADIYGPSIPKMFNIENVQPTATIAEDGRQLIDPIEQYGVEILSIGFFVNPDSAIVWRGAMASNAVRQLINDANWGMLDYFVIDMPPGTSDIHLTLVDALKITGAIVVSTPQQVALADARKGIDMFQNEKVNVPILGLVENMAWFTPAEHPDEKYYIFGNGGCRALAEERNIPLLAQIPLVQSICESGDNGAPISFDPHGIVAQHYLELAKKIVEG